MSDVPFGFDPIEFEYYNHEDSNMLMHDLETCNECIRYYTENRNIITHILRSRNKNASKDEEGC